MVYAWKLHHLLNEIAQGKKTAKDLSAYLTDDDKEFGLSNFRLTFTSNHDENSWSGSEFERMGPAANVCAVLCFTLPKGQPLIYTGQEVGVTRRIEFFEKDPVTDWSENEYTSFFRTLVSLRHDNPCLDAGDRTGLFSYLEGYPEQVFAFERAKGSDKVVVLANLGGEAVPYDLSLEGKYRNPFTGEVSRKFSGELPAWGYLVLETVKK